MKTIPIKDVPNLVNRIKDYTINYPDRDYLPYLEKCLVVPKETPRWKIYQYRVAYTNLHYEGGGLFW